MSIPSKKYIITFIPFLFSVCGVASLMSYEIYAFGRDSIYIERILTSPRIENVEKTIVEKCANSQFGLLCIDTYDSSFFLYKSQWQKSFTVLAKFQEKFIVTVSKFFIHKQQKYKKIEKKWKIKKK